MALDSNVLDNQSSSTGSERSRTVDNTNVNVSSTNSDDTTNLRTITGAYDPNDKLASTSSGNTDVWQLNEDEWIDYTIRFQNTGTDTAFNVIITDTVSIWVTAFMVGIKS